MNDLFVYGISAEAWARRYGIQPFSTPCQCGEILTTTLPFARGTLRGLQAPECKNGCHDSYSKWKKLGCPINHKGIINYPPYAMVRDPKFGDLFDGNLDK